MKKKVKKLKKKIKRLERKEAETEWLEEQSKVFMAMTRDDCKKLVRELMSVCNHD